MRPAVVLVAVAWIVAESLLLPCPRDRRVLLETAECRCTGVPCTSLPKNNASQCENSCNQNIFEPSKLCHLSVRGEITDLSGFLNLDGLQSLDLSRNSLANPETFNLTGLKSLDLSHNEIGAIEDAPFRTLTSLEVLDLSANAINSLDGDAFEGLRSLQLLDLSQNRIGEVNPRCFASLPALQSLNFSRNLLVAVNDGNFGGLQKLQQLDLSWNNLVRVAPGSLQLPNLLRLLLAGNKALGGSYELYLGPGKLLQNVDVSRCNLVRIPAALTQSIRILRLQQNFIANVNCGDFDSYPLLQMLDLSYNLLEVIEEDAFGRLDLLKILYLTNNKLKSVPMSLPNSLSALHLEHNNIETISRGEFEGLDLLEVLLLNDNKIKNITEDAFEPLRNLCTLDLSDNPIHFLPSGLFSGNERLEFLRMSHLEARFEPENAPIIISSTLISVDLSYSPVLAKQIVNNTAFLLSARELQKINLSGNEIMNVRNDLLTFLPQMHTVILQDNPLNCSDLQWLATWLRKQNSPENHQTTCEYPLELRGTYIADIQNVVNYSDDADIRSKITGIYNKRNPVRNTLLKGEEINNITVRRATHESNIPGLINSGTNLSHPESVPTLFPVPCQNCSDFASKSALNEPAPVDNTTNLPTDSAKTPEKYDPGLAESKDNDSTALAGAAKSPKDNGPPFEERNANDSRQTGHDNLPAEITPFALMNSGKGVQGTQIVSDKETSGRKNVAHVSTNFDNKETPARERDKNDHVKGTVRASKNVSSSDKEISGWTHISETFDNTEIPDWKREKNNDHAKGNVKASENVSSSDKETSGQTHISTTFDNKETPDRKREKNNDHAKGNIRAFENLSPRKGVVGGTGNGSLETLPDSIPRDDDMKRNVLRPGHNGQDRTSDNNNHNNNAAPSGTEGNLSTRKDNNTSPDTVALAMTVKNGAIEPDEHNGHVALVVFLIVALSGTVVVGALALRTRYRGRQRVSGDEEFAVSNLPGITDLW